MIQATEPSPLAVDRLRAASLVGICPRSFDTYFGDVPKIKIGSRTLYLVRDLVNALESMRVEGSSPVMSRTILINAGELASNREAGAKSDAQGPTLEQTSGLEPDETRFVLAEVKS